MSQYARPSSIISATGWYAGFTAANLSDSSDATYARQQYKTTGYYEGLAALSAVTDPQSSTGHTVTVRARASAGGGAGEKFTFTFYQGATVIATSSTQTANRSAFADHTLTLTATEADSITNYADLRVGVLVTSLNGGEEIWVADIWVTVPDAPAQTITGSFSADAVIKANSGTKTFSSDAITRRTEAPTGISADAVLHKTISPTGFSADAIIHRVYGLDILRATFEGNLDPVGEGFAQSFWSWRTTARLQSIDFQVKKIGTPPGDLVLTLSMWTTDGDTPDTHILIPVVLQIPPTDIGTDWTSFTVRLDYPLDPTRSYWLYWHGSTALPETDTYILRGSLDDYPDGGWLIKSGGTWPVGSLSDVGFVIEVAWAAFTADATFFGNSGTKTFTADAWFVRAYILTADAVIKKTWTPTGLNADAVLRRTQEHAFSADAVFKRNSGTKSFSAEAAIKRVHPPYDITADATLLRVREYSFSADADIWATVERSFTADAIRKRTQFLTGSFTTGTPGPEQGFGTDMSVVLGQQFVLPVDAVLTSVTLPLKEYGNPTDDIIAEIQTNLHHSTPIVFDEPSGVVISRAAPFSMLNLTTSYQPITFVFGVGCSANTPYWVVLHRTGALNGNVYPSGRLNTEFGWNGWWTDAGNGFRQDLAVYLTGNYTAFACAADAVLKKTIALSFTADAVIKKTWTPTGLSADASFLRTTTLSFSADAVIKKTWTEFVAASQTTSLIDQWGLHGDGGSAERLAQSFILPSATLLARAVVPIFKGGVPSDNFILSVRPSLDGTVLASDSVPASSVDYSPIWTNFALPGVVIPASTTYYLEATRSGARDATNEFLWKSGSNVYADGAVWHRESGTWQTLAISDFAFIVYGAYAFLADAVLRKTIPGSFSADAFVLGWFTADAWIEGAFTGGSISADAIIRRNSGTLSFSSDAVIVKTQTGFSFAGDAVIRRTQQGSASADAVIWATLERTLAADAVFLAPSGTKALAADAVIARVQEGSLSADAVIARNSGILSLGADAIFLASSGTKDLSADAIALRTQDGSLSADAIALRTQAFTFSVDGIKKATVEGSLSADACLRSSAEGSVAADAIFLRIQEGSLSADADIWATVERSFTADAWFFSSAAFAFVADAVIKANSGTKTFSADAEIIAATVADSFTADAIFRWAVAGAIDAEAILWATIPGSLTADAVLWATVPGSLSADAVIWATLEKIFSADAWFAGSGAGAFSADAALRRTFEHSFSTDAVTLKNFEFSLSADAVLVRAVSGVLSADAAIRWTREGSLSADAVLQRGTQGGVTADAVIFANSGTKTFSADAWFVATGVESITADAVIKANSGTKSFTADASLGLIGTGQFAADATLRRTASGNFSADAVLRGTPSATISANAVLRWTAQGAFSADASKLKRTQAALTADALVKATRTVGFSASATLFGTVVSSFTADAVFVVHRESTFSVDATFRRTGSGTFASDAVIWATVSGSLSASAVLTGTRTGFSFTADAVFSLTEIHGGSFTADACISNHATLEIEADAFARTFAADAFAVTIDWTAGDMSLTFVQGNTEPPLQSVIHEEDVPANIVDLSTATEVRFQMRKPGDHRYTVNGVGAVLDPLAGLVQYEWAENDLSVPGTYLGQWEIHYPSGGIQTTSPEVEITVRRR